MNKVQKKNGGIGDTHNFEINMILYHLASNKTKTFNKGYITLNDE